MSKIEDISEEGLPKYQMFWVDDHQDKHVVLKFDAENDDDALAKRNEFCKNHVDHAYYYGRICYVRHLHDNGTVTLHDMHDGLLCRGSFPKRKCFVMRALEAVTDFFSYWMWQKPVDWWYALKDIAYLLKHGEARSNQWNLDSHLIDTIVLNVPSLIENSHSMMFIDDAIRELHGNDPGFDLKAYHNEYCSGYPDDVENLALEIQQREYKKLLLSAKLYKYYADGGIIDTNDPDEVLFDKKWRHTLPVKDGTYDEFDYDELNKLCQTSWNDVWEWIKLHGHTLYD